AKDFEGTLSKLTFMLNGKPLSEKNDPPFYYNWVAKKGRQEIVITAFDNLATPRASLTKKINVLRKQEANMIPALNVISPLATDSIHVGDTLVFEVNPQDSDGQILSVTFMLNEKIYNKLFSPPYKTQWTATPGEHRLSMYAIDDKGYSSAVKNINFNVTNKAKENQPPILRLLSPTPNQEFVAGSSITIESMATDLDGSIQDVTTFHNGQIVNQGSNPSQKVTLSATEGMHEFTIRATDDKGLQSIERLTITVRPKPTTSSLLADIALTDPALKACVVREAAKHQWTQQQEVSSLDCSYQSIISTQGLENLTQLKTLNLSNNLLTEVDLSGLTQLTNIDLSFNLLKGKALNSPKSLTTENYAGNILTSDVEKPIKTASIFIKDKNKPPRFTIADIQKRLSGAVDSLIRTKSFNKEGLTQIDTFGWYELETTDFQAALQRYDWTSASPIIEAVTSKSLDLTDYDLVTIFWDDTENTILVNGSAYPYKHNLTINQQDFGDKAILHIFLDDNSLSSQCFYHRQIYNTPDICYNNPYGDNLTRLDSLVFHEFLHTRELAAHSLGYFCENVILGKCTSTQYNMFDALSSARFFGLDLNASFKHQIHWLDDTQVYSVDQLGTYQITLHDLSYPASGNKAIKVDYQDFAGFDIWLEYRLPSPFDYGLYNDAFTSIREGVLIYKNALLLDATPNTPAVDYKSPADVAITQDFYSEVLGLAIQIEKVDPKNRSINVKIIRTSPKATRNVPNLTVGMIDCVWEGQCSVKQGSQMTTKIFQAQITDIGFGSNFNKAWKYTLIGLPEGLTTTDTGIKRQFTSRPNSYSYSPHTYITFTANDNVALGKHNFTFRLTHPDDSSIYQDYRLVITVVP
ncbi:MAG: leucine-rich repeat domain-containing protein, partial [Cellvibrionales bacterium]|nr:leucine-rich repeat domain-containing protein [Cellvibrionales bacterium]